MDQRYFKTVRAEIFPHLPPRFSRLLDVGCGAGATVAAIRAAAGAEGPAWVGGIELDEAAAAEAEAHCDRVWQGDIEASRFDEEIGPGSLDVILCLDVLEHLADPWSVVRRLSPLLVPGGRLIVSVPNIRNWKFLWRLTTKADFRYRDAGLLDRTHLRFFVRPTAVELATCGGLVLGHVGSTRPFRPPDARWLLSRLAFGRLDDFMIKQFVVVAERPVQPDRAAV